MDDSHISPITDELWLSFVNWWGRSDREISGVHCIGSLCRQKDKLYQHKDEGMDRRLHQRNQWDVITHPCNSFNCGLVNKIIWELYHTESFYTPHMRPYSLTCGNYLYLCSNHCAVTNHTILLLWRMLSSQSHRKMVLLVALSYCSLRLFSNGSMGRAHVSAGRVITYRNAIHTVKPVYNDHLMGYFSAFWRSSRWPLAT